MNLKNSIKIGRIFEEYETVIYTSPDGREFENFSTEKLPTYGDLMTLDEFFEMEDCGCFTSDDGQGYYATEDEMTNISYKFDKFKYGFEYIMWFNK